MGKGRKLRWNILVVLAAAAPETAADTIPRPVAVKPASGSFVHEFPAASMTALKFRRNR